MTSTVKAEYTEHLFKVLLDGKRTREFVTKNGKKLKLDAISVKRVNGNFIEVSFYRKGLEIVRFGGCAFTVDGDEMKIVGGLKIRLKFTLK